MLWTSRWCQKHFPFSSVSKSTHSPKTHASHSLHLILNCNSVSSSSRYLLWDAGHAVLDAERLELDTQMLPSSCFLCYVHGEVSRLRWTETEWQYCSTLAPCRVVLMCHVLEPRCQMVQEFQKCHIRIHIKSEYWSCSIGHFECVHWASFWFTWAYAANDRAFDCSFERRCVWFSVRAGMWYGQVEISLSRVKMAMAIAATI